MRFNWQISLEASGIANDSVAVCVICKVHWGRRPCGTCESRLAFTENGSHKQRRLSRTVSGPHKHKRRKTAEPTFNEQKKNWNKINRTRTISDTWALGLTVMGGVVRCAGAWGPQRNNGSRVEEPGVYHVRAPHYTRANTRRAKLAARSRRCTVRSVFSRAPFSHSQSRRLLSTVATRDSATAGQSRPSIPPSRHNALLFRTSGAVFFQLMDVSIGSLFACWANRSVTVWTCTHKTFRLFDTFNFMSRFGG